MSEGIVRWFNYQKGYGFIYSEEFSTDIFFHHESFVEDLNIHKDSTVIFDAVGGEKGLKAIKVTLKE
jgi:cold shock CspA family protein